MWGLRVVVGWLLSSSQFKPIQDRIGQYSKGKKTVYGYTFFISNSIFSESDRFWAKI